MLGWRIPFFIAIFILLLGPIEKVKAEVYKSNANDNVNSAQKGEIENHVPNMPIVNNVTNKDLFISGLAEMNQTVYVKADGKLYSQKLEETNLFNIYFQNNKPLKEGSIITVYVTDELGNSSSSVTLKVADIIPPLIPTVKKITDKSFVITGMTEVGSTVYVRRNSHQYGIIKSDSLGRFSMPIPLHSKGTIFEIYSVDPANNKSGKAKITVIPQTRIAKKLLNTPVVKQMPELPRGCEVTSLTMLLRFVGISVNKLTLAKQVKKDPTIYRAAKGKVYFGNPNIGFVGDMYSFSKPGLGVFNGPIELLTRQYLPNRTVNLTGQSFEGILNYVSAGHPVWIITTSWFSAVPSKFWVTWYTPQGPIKITKKEHSVLITGYDSNYVYFNDPLDGIKNKKKPMKSFIDGWKQYGSQAISFY